MNKTVGLQLMNIISSNGSRIWHIWGSEANIFIENIVLFKLVNGENWVSGHRLGPSGSVTDLVYCVLLSYQAVECRWFK